MTKMKMCLTFHWAGLVERRSSRLRPIWICLGAWEAAAAANDLWWHFCVRSALGLTRLSACCWPSRPYGCFGRAHGINPQEIDPELLMILAGGDFSNAGTWTSVSMYSVYVLIYV